MNPRLRKPAVNLPTPVAITTSATAVIEAVDAAAAAPADRAATAVKIAVPGMVNRDAPKAAANPFKAVKIAASRAAKASTAVSVVGAVVEAADAIAAKAAGAAVIAVRVPRVSKVAAQSERNRDDSFNRRERNEQWRCLSAVFAISAV